MTTMSEANYQDQKAQGLITEWPAIEEILKITDSKDLRLEKLNTFCMTQPLLGKLNLSESAGGMTIQNQSFKSGLHKANVCSIKDLKF